MIEFLKVNYAEIMSIVIPFLWLIVRLTPTNRDNDMLAKLIRILDIIFPNRKKGGGTH